MRHCLKCQTLKHAETRVGAVEAVGAVGAVGAVRAVGAVGAVGAVEAVGAVGAVGAAVQKPDTYKFNMYRHVWYVLKWYS